MHKLTARKLAALHTLQAQHDAITRTLRATRQNEFYKFPPRKASAIDRLVKFFDGPGFMRACILVAVFAVGVVVGTEGALSERPQYSAR